MSDYNIFTLAWDSMMLYARNKNYNFLVKAMMHARYGNGAELTLYNDSAESQNLIKIPKIKNTIDSWIAEYKRSNKRDFYTSGELTTSDSAEFYYVIQHYELYGTIQSNGNMLIRCYDKYNFDDFRTFANGISVGNTGNDIGLIVQTLGVIKPYAINIYSYVWAGNYTGGSTGGSTGNFLNLKPHMQSWAVYNVNGPYTKAYAIGSLAPAQFGGLSYSILESKGNDVYIIQTESFGRCAIWAPRDNDSSITSSPAYSNGNTSGGGSTGGGEYEVRRYSESGICYPQTTINFRSSPNAESSSNIIGQYFVGENVNYDLVVITNKYAYISWIGASSGTRRYMAVRDINTGERWANIV